MPTVLQFRRYNNVDILNETGLPGEIFINLTENTLNVQDGITAGGNPIRVNFSNVTGDPTSNPTMSSALNAKVSSLAYNDHVFGAGDRHNSSAINYVRGSVSTVEEALNDIFLNKPYSGETVLTNQNNQTISGPYESVLNISPLASAGEARLSIGSNSWSESTPGVVSCLRLNGHVIPPPPIDPYADPYLDPYADPYLDPYADPYLDPYADPYGFESMVYYKMQVENDPYDAGSYLQLVKNTGSGEQLLLEVDPSNGNVSIQNDLLVMKNLYVEGLIYLQSVSVDSVSIVGEFDSSLIPNTNNIFDIGTTSNRWKQLNVVTINCSGNTVTNGAIVGSSGLSSSGAVSLTANTTTTHDVEITDYTKGIILRSQNGSRWRVTVSNDGNLVTTSI